MQTFKHGEHTITCDAAGIFHAKHGGTNIEAASLAAMKKKLDAAPEFVAFDALDSHYHSGEPVRVVGITRPRASWRNREWKLASGGERASVYEDTPENRKAIKAYNALVEKHRAIRDVQESAEREANAKIKRLTPPK